MMARCGSGVGGFSISLMSFTWPRRSALDRCVNRSIMRLSRGISVARESTEWLKILDFVLEPLSDFFMGERTELHCEQRYTVVPWQPWERSILN